MSGGDFIVAPRSSKEIERIANSLRAKLGLENEVFFPIVDVVELLGSCGVFELDILSAADMSKIGCVEAYVTPDGRILAVREDVYKSACANDGRARFTLAHELGHVFLHAGRPMTRIQPGVRVKVYRRAEPQADFFAACLLMPILFISPDDTAMDLMVRFGVSRAAAEVRLRWMQKRVWG